MKNHRHNDSGTRKTEWKKWENKNIRKLNKSGQKEEKATEEEYQASLAQKSKLREGKCYFCGNSGHIFPDSSEEASTSKDKWALKTAIKNLCAESQKAESQYGNKNHNKIKMKNTTFWISYHGQKEPIISFKNKVYSLMCWVI